MTRPRKIFPWIFWLIGWLTWTLALLLVSLATLPAFPAGGWIAWDKLHHAVAYAVLTLLGGRSLVLLGLRPCRGWSLSAGFSLFFGAVLEILQMSLTTHRTAEWGDLFADGIGAGAVCLAAWLAYRRRPGKSSR